MQVDDRAIDPVRVKNEKLGLLIVNQPVGNVATLVNAFILAAIHWRMVPTTQIVLWLVSIVVVAAGRSLLCRQFNRHDRQNEDLRLWNRLLRAGVLGSGIVWGIAGLILFPEQSMIHQMLTIFTIGGMLAGASTAYSAFRSVFFLFSLPAMVPVIIYTFTFSDVIHVSMGAMSSLFLILMTAICFRNNRFIADSVKLGLANNQLIAFLSDAKSRTEEINNQLLLENFERKKAEKALEDHQYELESIVRKRTAELEKRNEELRCEVAERERAQAALADSEERYRLLVEKANIGIMLIQHGLIGFANRYTAMLSGYGTAEIGGRSFLDFIHADDQQTAIRNYQSGLKGEANPDTYSIRIVHKSGRVLWLEVNAVRMTYEDQPAVLLFFKDVTQQRHLEKQLLQAEKMAAIGQLAAGVAHEINNPVGFVNSNLHTLQQYHTELHELISSYREVVSCAGKAFADGQWNDAFAEMIDTVERCEKKIDLDYILQDCPALIRESMEGADRIRKIVSDLKDFAHPGHEDLQLADINQNIESTLNIVWNELKYHAEVVRQFGTIPMIECHAQQLNQVFMNILVNAAQAIDGKGRITIETGTGNGHVQVKISDTGVGIEPAHLTRIFDPFFTTKEVGKGTGLGLNVSYNIIQKHHGSITVESQVGKGSTFTIQLPIHPESL